MLLELVVLGERHFLHLQRNQEGNRFYGIVASVHVVPHEEVVGVWRLPSDLKQLHEVMKLTVDISTHRHWTSHLLHIGLLRQDLLCLQESTKKTTG